MDSIAEPVREVEALTEDRRPKGKAKKKAAEPAPLTSPDVSEDPTSPYDPPISRKLMERITGLSTPTLVKYEQDGTIHPRKIKHGGLEFVTYRIKDVQTIFRKRGVSFKKGDSAEVISIFSQKGGVGKSSLTQHLGAMLSLVGKVLVIDLDSQADATSLFGINVRYSDVVEADEELDPSILELMDWQLADGSDAGYRRLPFEKVVKKISPSLHVVPSDLDLGEINYSLNRLELADRQLPDGRTMPGELMMIQEVIDQVRNQYDFILFDCPPNIETCNVSALYASNRIVVPLELEAKCLKTMSRNWEFLVKLRDSGAGFSWDKVLVVPNKFRHENIKIKALARIQDIFSGREDIALSQAVIPNNTIIDRCAENKEPVFVAATKYGKGVKTAIPQAKEFTDLFWVIMHEILDLPVDRLVFADVEESEPK
jgi:cellulose biosynthesis protein BcsQ